MGKPPAWYSDQQVSQEPGQTTEFDYNDPEFMAVVREIVQETLSEGMATDRTAMLVRSHNICE
jgi:hypothetical protein